MGFFTLLANFLGAVEYKYKFLRFFKEHLSHIPKKLVVRKTYDKHLFRFVIAIYKPDSFT